MFLKRLKDRAALVTGNFAKLFGDMEVPPLPQIASRLVRMSQDENVRLADMSKVLAGDAGLSSRILKTVNSSSYGLRHEVTNIHQAIALLGMREVQSLALGFLAAGCLPSTAEGFDRVTFWQESVQRALFAQILASRIAPGTEGEAFISGLLQNMALPILLDQWGEHYLPIMLEAQEGEETELHEVEREKLSWDHAQAAAWMARNWGFPDILVCCVGLHHATYEELESMEFLETPVAAVACSAQLPNAQAWCTDHFNIAADDCQEMFRTTDQACQELASLFGIPSPEPISG